MTSEQVCQALKISERQIQNAREKKYIRSVTIHPKRREYPRGEVLVLGLALELARRRIVQRSRHKGGDLRPAFRMAREVLRDLDKASANRLVMFVGSRHVWVWNEWMALGLASASDEPVSIVDVLAIRNRIFLQ